MSDSNREEEDQPDDTMRERADANTLAIWVMMGADRRLVWLGIVATLFVSVIVGGVIYPTPTGTVLTNGDPVETLAQALITSTVTAVTLVLTLSQIVLSQEQGPVGDQRDRMKGALTFRDDVAEMIDQQVSPTEPSAFFQALLAETERRADALEAAVGEGEVISEQLSAFVQSLKTNGREVGDRLDDAMFGEFEVVRAALDYDYSWKLYATKRLQAEHTGDLSESGDEAFEELAEILALFGPAREHFKTLYFQWELADLSRAVLWGSIPSLVVSMWALLFFDVDAFPGALFGIPYSLLQIGAIVAIALVPFAVLLAYILRILTVTKRTLAIGPFILRETDPEIEFDWESEFDR